MPLPREHGAWVMLLLSILTGWTVGQIPDLICAAAATLSVVAGFLAQTAWLEWRAGRASVLWFASELVVAGAGATVAVIGGGRWAAVVATIVGSVAALALFLRVGSANTVGKVAIKAWGAHAWAALAMGGVAVWIGAAGGSGANPFSIWWSLSGSFVGGILLVRALRGGAEGSHRWLAFWAILTAIAWTWMGKAEQGAVFLLWLPIPLRWIVSRGWIPVRRGWKDLGILETMLGTWTVVWTIVALG